MKPFDDVLIRSATRLMWASLALVLGIGLGFAWRSMDPADERAEIQTTIPIARNEKIPSEQACSDRGKGVVNHQTRKEGVRVRMKND